MATTPMTSPELFGRIQDVLESLFPTGWFEKLRNASHPAARQRELCRLLIEQGGIVGYPTQVPLMPEMGRLLLDTMTWIETSGGDANSLTLGDVGGYGDPLVRKKIESRVQVPDLYRALMTELTIGGWYRPSYSVTPFEKEGYPDLRVDNGQEPPLLVECKRLRTAAEARVRQAIKKANAQIKRASQDDMTPFDSAVVLDLSDAVGLRYGSSEWKPPVVNDIIGFAERALSGEKNRSVRQAWVTWDSYRYAHGAGRGTTVAAYMRRVEVVTHAGMSVATPADTPRFGGSTGVHMINWRASDG